MKVALVANVIAGVALLQFGWGDWQIQRAIAEGPTVEATVVGPGSCHFWGWGKCYAKTPQPAPEAWIIRFRTEEGKASEANVVTDPDKYYIGARMTVRYDPREPTHAEDVSYRPNYILWVILGFVALLVVSPSVAFVMWKVARAKART